MAPTQSHVIRDATGGRIGVGMGAIEKVACKETGWAASNVGITVSLREHNEHFES